MIHPANSAPCMLPPAGAGLASDTTEFAPVRAVLLAPSTVAVATEFAPIRAIVLDRAIGQAAPVRAIVQAIKRAGVRVINQSDRNSGIGTPVTHESIEL